MAMSLSPYRESDRMTRRLARRKARLDKRSLQKKEDPLTDVSFFWRVVSWLMQFSYTYLELRGM